MEVDMNNKRLEWIDICKGILIITIVLMHINYSFFSNNPIGKYFSNLTSLYKVSIFFCVAGLTLKDEKLKDTWDFVKGKIKTLWLNAVIIGLIEVFLHNILISIGFYELGTDYAGKVMASYSVKDFLKQSILTLVMANREVIIGPMWYAYVLFMALIILCVLDWMIRRFVKDDDCARKVRFIVTLATMLISSILTNVFGLTIPRFNNTLTAVFLIDLCQFLYRELKWTFSNKWAFIVSILVLLNLPLYGYLSMNNNYFENPSFLIVVAICGMYTLYFISQKISGGGYWKGTFFYWKTVVLDHGIPFYGV